MLGVVVTADGSAGAAILGAAAARLRLAGVPVAGALQRDGAAADGGRTEMDLHLLDGTAVVRISQRLGPRSRGCRLDPDGLERAVGLVAAAIARKPALLVVNKFGRQEAEGRGFRPLIGETVAAGLPVLTAVHPRMLDAFDAFAGELGVRLPEDADAVVSWALARAGNAVGRTR